MIMNLITLFVCINVGMSILAIQGTPFYVNGTDNCFFPATGAPNASDIFAVDAGLINGTGTVNGTQLLRELIEPTNATLTDPLFGDNNVLNAFFDTVDQAAKTLEVLKNVVGGKYITNVIDHFVISCSFDENGTLVSGGEHEVWTTFKSGIEVVFILLAIFTIFYWATGRGHILTS